MPGLAQKRIVLVAATAAVLALTLGSARADLTDGQAAAESNSNDVGQSMVDNARQNATGSITCDVDAAGAPITQHTDVVVGDIFPRDFAEGHGECLDLQGSAFSGTLVVDVEYWTGSAWAAVVETIRSKSVGSHEGVALFSPLITQGAYKTFPNQYLNRYHRGHAVLFVPGQRYDAYSKAVWFMKP